VFTAARSSLGEPLEPDWVTCVRGHRISFWDKYGGGSCLTSGAREPEGELEN